MRELKILAVVVALTLITYWGVEPYAHHQMHPKVEAADFTFSDVKKDVEDVAALQGDATNGGVDDSQTSSTNTIEVGEADATTKKTEIAQKFVPTEDAIRSVFLYKKADTGTFTGTVTVTVEADSSGEPSGCFSANKQSW